MPSNAPIWMMDDPSLGGGDPLLDQLEEERKRRAAEQAAQQAQPAPFPQPSAPALEPFSGFPQPSTPQPTVADPEIERQVRDEEARLHFEQARRADQEAAGVEPDGRPHVSRQDIDGGLRQPTQTSEGVGAWDGMVNAASAAFDVPTNVIKAIIDIESKGDPSATSHAGAAGLMQVMPFHARGGDDLYDPATNIMYGTRILAENYARYGSWEKAAAAYFGAIDGEGNITAASDGNTDGYGYVDAFSAKARAYADAQRGTAPTYGPSLPGARPLDITNLRPSQLPESNADLSISEAYAACGPAAAIVFAAMMGRAPTLKEAVEMARSIKAWDEGVGMYGMDAEVRLIQALGGSAKVSPGLDPDTLVREVANGNPVIVDSPGHYGVISGFDPASGRFYFGTSATDLKGGQPWMTLEEYQALNATGAIRGMLLVDNPLGGGVSSATAQPGPTLPRTWRPEDTFRDPGETEAEARQREMEAAERLAEQIKAQVERSQERARRETEQQRQPIPEGMVRTTGLSAEFPDATSPAALDLLRPDRTDDRTPEQAPLSQQSSERTSEADSTEGYVARAREIEQRFSVGPEGRYASTTERDQDPEFLLEATKLARDMQGAAAPQTKIVTGPDGTPMVQDPDGDYHRPTPEEWQAEQSRGLDDLELANRESFLERQVEARREAQQTGIEPWQMTPDQYVEWRRSQGLEIRQDEYQRHAAAVLDAAERGQDVPAPVRDAYGVDGDGWQIARRGMQQPSAAEQQKAQAALMRALTPVMAVANGAPYDGADSDTRLRGLDQLPSYARAIARDTADTWATTWAGLIKSALRAGEAYWDREERRTGIDLGDNPFTPQADLIGRELSAHPERQSPIRATESAFDAALRHVSSPYQFANDVAMLGPYLIASSAAASGAGQLVGGLGVTGAAAAWLTSALSSLAVTGTTSFGQFYDEATHADPRKGEVPLSKDAAFAWAGGHALIQTAFEVALGKGMGSAIGKGAEQVLDRSPLIKKASELMARTWLPHMLREGASEALLEEAPQQVAENLLAKASYDPGRGIFDGVLDAIFTTFGPSAAGGVRGAMRDAQAATLRNRTALDESTLDRLRTDVTDVASAERFADEHFARTQEYGRSVGWDQREIDVAQFRAAQAIYGYGLAREIQSRRLTPDAAAADPQVQRGELALNLAGAIERRLADRRGYEAERRVAANNEDLARIALDRGYATGADGVSRFGTDSASGVPDRDRVVPLQNINVPQRDNVTREDPREDSIRSPLPPATRREDPGSPFEQGGATGLPAAAARGEESPTPYPRPRIAASLAEREQADDLGRRYGYDVREQARGWTGQPLDAPTNAADELREVERTYAALSPRSLARLATSDDPTVSALARRTIAGQTVDAPEGEQADRMLAQAVRANAQSGILTLHGARQAMENDRGMIDVALRSPDPDVRQRAEADSQRLERDIASVSAAIDHLLRMEGRDRTAEPDEFADGGILDNTRDFRSGRDFAEDPRSRAGSTASSEIASEPFEIGGYAAGGRPVQAGERSLQLLHRANEVTVTDDDFTFTVRGQVTSRRRGARQRFTDEQLHALGDQFYAKTMVWLGREVLDGLGGAERFGVRALVDALARANSGREGPSRRSGVDALIPGAADVYAANDYDANRIELNPWEILQYSLTQYRQLHPDHTQVDSGELAKIFAHNFVLNVAHEALHDWNTEAEYEQDQTHSAWFLATLDAVEERLQQESGPLATTLAFVATQIQGIFDNATDRDAFLADARALRTGDALPADLVQRRDEPRREQHAPGDADVGRGPPGPAVDGESTGGSEGTGAPGAGVSDGAEQSRTSAEPARADGVPTADAVGDDAGRGTDASGVGSGHGSQERASDATTGRTEPASDPSASADHVNLNATFILGEAIAKEISRLKAERRPDQQIVDALVRRTEERAGQAIARGIIDPQAIRTRSGFATNSPLDQIMAETLRRLFPEGTDVGPRPISVEEYARVAIQRMDREHRDHLRWIPGRDLRVPGIGFPELAFDEAGAVNEILEREGYIDSDGREIHPTIRKRNAERRAQADRQRDEILEQRRLDEQIEDAEQDEAVGQQVESDASTETPATERPTVERSVRSRTPQTPTVADHLEAGLALIADDDELASHTRGGDNWGARQGTILANRVIVDGDKDQTARNRRIVIEAIKDRRRALDDEAASIRTIPAPERTREQRERLARVNRIRDVLRTTLTGFGESARPDYEVRGTDPETGEEVRVRWVIPLTGQVQAAVRGVGIMQVDAGRTTETSEALGVLADVLGRIGRTSFTDRDGNAQTLGEHMGSLIETLYGSSGNAERFIADAEHLAAAWMRANPDADVRQPELMGMLLAAFDALANEAFENVKAAAAEDRTNNDPNGTRKAAALADLAKLLSTSSLLPSIKKQGTTAARVMRTMQLATRRNEVASQLKVAQELAEASTGLRTLLERAQEQIKNGQVTDEMLRRFRLVATGATSPDQLANTPLEQVARAFYDRSTGGILGRFTDAAEVATSVGDLLDILVGGKAENTNLFTAREWQDLAVMLQHEEGGTRTYDRETLRKIAAMAERGLLQMGRRAYNREEGAEGIPRQVLDKRRWRGPDRENYAKELLAAQLDSLNARAMGRLRQAISDGLTAEDMQAFWAEPARAGSEYSNADLQRDLLRKIGEIDSWRAQNDPDSRAYKVSHPKIAGAVAANAPSTPSLSPQHELGFALREEAMLDGQIRLVTQLLADAEAGRVTDDPRQVRIWLVRLEAERDQVRSEIADLKNTITIDLINSFSERLDVADARRDAAEAKLGPLDLELRVAEALGAKLQERFDREAMQEALAGRDIGKVDRAVRKLLDQHFHEAYDDAAEAEYWVRFQERLEKEHGDSEDPIVRIRLQEMRDRIQQKLTELAEHPLSGEDLARPLRARLVRAVHGEAGSTVLAIQRALTAPGYVLEGERRPVATDVNAIRDAALLDALAGTTDDPGPLALVLADRSDTQAYNDLTFALDVIEGNAPGGLGTAFKSAVLSSVEVLHKRAAIMEMLPDVEAVPNDPMIRYLVEAQLLDLRQHLADRETDPWFRRRYGGVEVALRGAYERAIERGADRLEKLAERAAEAANFYTALVDAGVATEADRARAERAEVPKKMATQVILERNWRQQAEALRDRILKLNDAYWSETDASIRERLEAERERAMDELQYVGAYEDEDGKLQGTGPDMARKLTPRLEDRFFKEEQRQGERQQGWTQRAEIAALTKRIREVARYQGLTEEGTVERDALQTELDGLLSDLAAVGLGEAESGLRDMGQRAADRLVEQLGLQRQRSAERAADLAGRREATLAVRDLRSEAMVHVRALAKDPQDMVARAGLDRALAAMDQVGYTEHRDETVDDLDPINGGIIGRRTERREVPVFYGREQADRIRDVAAIRIGATIPEMQALSTSHRLDRDAETGLIQAVTDGVNRLATAARSEDALGRMGDVIADMLGALDTGDERLRAARQKIQQQLQRTGFRRAMLKADADAMGQVATFFGMLAPTVDPATGEAVYDPRVVSRAMRLVITPNWADYYREYGIVAMLSSPTTFGPFGVNMIGQALNAAIQPARWAFKLGASEALHLAGYERSVYASEARAGARALADWTLWRDAGRNALQIVRYGHSSAQMQRASETGDLKDLRSEHLVDATADLGGPLKVLNWLARAAHTPLRILKASDDFVGTLVWAAAYEGQLERKQRQTGKTRAQVLADVRDLADVVEKTGHVQNTTLFRERDWLLSQINRFGHLHDAARSKAMRDPLASAGLQAVDMVLATYLPFTTVPYNAIKQSMELSGIGAAIYTGRALSDAVQGRGRLDKATARAAEAKGVTSEELGLMDRDNVMGRRQQLAETERIADFLGKAALGVMVQGIGFWLASLGRLTGDEPDEPDERAIDETEKLPPRSIRIGDRWYSYDNTPFAVPFAIAANIETRWRKEWAKLQKEAVPGERVSVGAGVAMAGAKGVRSAIFANFFLENIVEAANVALGNDNRTAGNAAYALASPLVTRHVPSLLAYLARQGDTVEGDTVERDTRAESVTGRLGNLAASRVPGLREQLPEKLNIEGRPVENKQPFGAGLISYSKSQQAQLDELFRVLEKYGAASNLQAPQQVSQTGNPNSTFEITTAEQRIWQKAFGERLRAEVNKAHTSESFTRVYNVPNGRDPQLALRENQRQMMEAAVGRARTYADGAVINTLGKVGSFERQAEIERRSRQYRERRMIRPSDAP